MALTTYLGQIWKLLSIAVGAMLVMATFSAFPGIPVTRFTGFIDGVLPSLISDPTAQRLVRFVLVRTPELTCYAYMGIVTFRYLARVYPIPMYAGEVHIPPRARHVARALVGIAAASSCASIGVFAYPNHALQPTRASARRSAFTLCQEDTLTGIRHKA